MKTIAFYNPECALPIPAVGGGAVEELENILADENEKHEKYDYVFFQPELTDEQKEKLNLFHYVHTKLEFLKKGGHNFFIRAIRKVFRSFSIWLKTKYEKEFLHQLNNYNIDKIVFEGSCPLSLLKCLSRKYGKHNLYFHIHSDYKPNRRIARYVGHLIGVSNFVLRKWPKFYEASRVDSVSLHVLKNCVRSEKFSNRISSIERCEIREKLGFTNNDLIVVFCGRIVPEKGVLELMKAVCNIKKSNVKLLIIGSPHFSRVEKSIYLKKVENCVLENPKKIVFTGYIDNGELYKYYQSADLHVVPSVWEEPGALVLTEGMLSGLPQIVTNSGGNSEYINKPGCIMVNKESQLTQNLTDAIQILSKDKERLVKMGQSNLTWAKKINSVSEFYKNFTLILGEEK